MLEGGEEGREGRGREEEEAVEDEKARLRLRLRRGGGQAMTDFASQSVGESGELLVVVVEVVGTLASSDGGATVSGFGSGGKDALTGTRGDGFAALQPCLESGAQRRQIERGGAVPVAMAGVEGEGGFGQVEVVGVHEGDVAPWVVFRGTGEYRVEVSGDCGFATGRNAAETKDEGVGDGGRRGRDRRGSGHVVMMAMVVNWRGWIE